MLKLESYGTKLVWMHVFRSLIHICWVA